MAWGKTDDFKCEIDKEFGDHIIDENGNNCVIVRRISWNDKPFKLDIRKYTYKDKSEVMLRGISITDNAADELAHTLVKNNYGKTNKLLYWLKNRSDYEFALSHCDENDLDNNEAGEEYYDPSEIFNIDNNIEEEMDDDNKS